MEKINKYRKIIKYFLIFVAFLAIIGAINEKDFNVNLNSSQIHTVVVTGQSEKMVSPDTASVSFTMTRKATSTEKATDSVNKRASDLISSLKGKGIEKEDIKTTNYSVNPEYSWSEGQRKFTGYRVSQTTEVKIRDLDKVSAVLALVNSAKADSVSGLIFFVDKDEDIKKELRSEAIADAKEEAKKLAGDLGVKLDKIIGYSEGSGNKNNYPVYARAEMAFDDGIDFKSPSIETGENKFTSSVSITYRID